MQASGALEYPASANKVQCNCGRSANFQKRSMPKFAKSAAICLSLRVGDSRATRAYALSSRGSRYDRGDASQWK